MPYTAPSNSLLPDVPLDFDPTLTAYLMTLNARLNQLFQTFNIPGLVTNVTATANTFVVVLSWNATKQATLYRIYRNTTGDFSSALVIGNVAASKTGVATLTYQDGQDQPTATRYYWITGVNERGIEGPKSAMVTVQYYDGNAVLQRLAIGDGARAGDHGIAIGVEANSENVSFSQAYGYQATDEFNYEVTFGSPAIPVEVFGFTSGFEGQKFRIFAQEQNLLIGTGASTLSTQFFEASDIVLGISTRVTVVIPTATTFTVTLETDATVLAVGVSTALDTTDKGTLNCPTRSSVGQAVRITPNLAPLAATGRVRITAYFYRLEVPTS